jgi:hypothetical protein
MRLTHVLIYALILFILIQFAAADTTFTDQGNDFIVSGYSNSTVTAPTVSSTQQPNNGGSLTIVQNNQDLWGKIFLYGGIILFLLAIIAILVIYILTSKGS